MVVALGLVLILLRKFLFGGGFLHAGDLVQHPTDVVLAILDDEPAPYPASVSPDIWTGDSVLYKLKLAI